MAVVATLSSARVLCQPEGTVGTRVRVRRLVGSA